MVYGQIQGTTRAWCHFSMIIGGDAGFVPGEMAVSEATGVYLPWVAVVGAAPVPNY